MSFKYKPVVPYSIPPAIPNKKIVRQAGIRALKLLEIIGGTDSGSFILIFSLLISLEKTTTDRILAKKLRNKDDAPRFEEIALGSNSTRNEHPAIIIVINGFCSFLSPRVYPTTKVVHKAIQLIVA